MTTSTTDAEAIARIIEAEIDRAANHYFTGGFTERASQIKNASSDTATAILSYLASRREAQEPVAWRYRWKIDGEWVSWRVSERSQASEHLLPSLEEYPLYLAPPAPSGEVERLRGALKKIKSLLSYANQNNVTPAARQSNINSAWWQADAALNGGRADE